MDAAALRGFLQIGLFVGGGGLVLAFLTPRDSAEFVLSVCSASMGGALVLSVVVAARLLRDRHD